MLVTVAEEWSSVQRVACVSSTEASCRGEGEGCQAVLGEERRRRRHFEEEIELFLSLSISLSKGKAPYI